MGTKIYTKTGDQGETSLFGGKRLPKNHWRIEAYGTVDELNSFLGLLRDTIEPDGVKELLGVVQNQLFNIGSNLAMDPDKSFDLPQVEDLHITQLEKAIDQMNSELPELKNFILPGGHPVVSYCHIARCVCRRAERRLVAVSLEEKVDPIMIKYLNRLSDYLFVLARKLGKDVGAAEVIWKPS